MEFKKSFLPTQNQGCSPIWQLIVPAESRHAIDVKRDGKKMTIPLMKIAVNDILEKSTWNYSTLSAAIKEHILDNPNYDEEQRKVIKEYLQISNKFRNLLDSSDISLIVEKIKAKGHKTAEITIWNWIDITMNPFSTEVMKEIASELGFSQDEIHTLLIGLANLKSLRSRPPLSELEQNAHKINLKVIKIDKITTRLDYVGKLIPIKNS